ncbi:MAG: hypothetical protein HUJ80_03760 [Firmicutes bacterium]|nr:hypothetical protein [Bacillota bacterium]
MDPNTAAGFLYTGLGLLLSCGFLLVFEESFSLSLRRLLVRKRLHRSIRKEVVLPPWLIGLGNLASSALGKEIDPLRVLFLLGFLFLAVLCLTVRILKPFFALGLSLIAAGFPVLLLAAGLSCQQSKSSREGIALATELSRRYRMENRNIYQALEQLVASDGDFPICRKHIYRLLLHLRASASPAEIRSACDAFAFALGTVWGSMLAVCIRVAAEKGTDISEGLTDIVVQLKSANRRSEERKRLNSEAARMTVWLVPVLYVATMALAVGYLDMSGEELMKNQFRTPEGLLFFSVSVFLFLFNRVVLKLVSAQKLDY